MSSVVGSLVVKIGADISALRQDVSGATKSLASLEGATNTVSTAIKALGAVAAANALKGLVMDSMKSIDAQAKLARSLSGTVNGLKGLRLAADDAGLDGLESSLNRFNRRLGAVEMGGGPAVATVKALGLNLRELQAMDVDEKIATVADAIRDAGMSSQEAARHLQQLGFEQKAAIELFQAGGDAIRGARDEIEALGLSLSDVDAAKVEQAGDLMNRLKLVTEAVIQRLTVQLAPILKVLSDSFRSMAQETQGFQRQTESAFIVTIKAAGYIGNALRAVHVALKFVEYSAWALGEPFVETARIAAQAFSRMIDGTITGVNLLIEQLNRISGVDITPVALNDKSILKGVEGFADAWRATRKDVYDQMKDLANEDWPSAKVEQFFQRVNAAAQEAAESAVEARRAIEFGEAKNDGGGGTGPANVPVDKSFAVAQRYTESLARQLDSLRQFVADEEEIQNERFERQMGDLALALDRGLVSLEEAHDMAERLEEQHMNALADIRQRGIDRVVSITTEGLGKAVSAFRNMAIATANIEHNRNLSMARTEEERERANEKHQRDMFESNKAFSIVEALISGARGVAQTMGSYPFPVNVPLALAHAGMAAAQVATIASTQFSGGRGRSGGSVASPSLRSGVGAVAPSGVGAGDAGGGGTNQLVQINLQGESFSRSSVISLMEQMNELTADGVRIAVR